MLNEPGGLNESPAVPIPTSAPQSDLRTKLRNAVEEVFFVETETDNLPAPITVSYTGQLQMDSLIAYERLDELFKALDHVPIFLIENGKQVVRAMRGRFYPRPRPVWPNVVLLILTLLSLLFVGASYEGVQFQSILDLLAGLPYTFCVMAILGTHELGHYFAARFHKVAVTLPYFIPMPFTSFGTLGAFIQLREPMRNRRVLLDVGAAGPLAGFIVAIPILLIGIKTSQVLPLGVTVNDLITMKVPIGTSYIMEGNSILYALSKFLIHGRFLPDGVFDVRTNQILWAGWTGLLVTAINLIPVGQLDGGHVLYSLLGERARILFIPLMIGLGVLSLIYSGWLLWLFLLLMLGRIYATPLDTITQLDRRRRIIAIVALVVFVLVFIPIPLQEFIPSIVP